MATRRKLTLINGTIDIEGDIRTYTATNSFEIGSCSPGWPSVPPLPFPDDDGWDNDDDWDDFDQADDRAK